MDGIIESSNIVEPVANVEPQNEVIEQVETSTESVIGEVATSQEETKPVQSAEENAKFAEVRRRAAEEARTKAKDETIAEMFGESHGIYTYAEYQVALAKQEQEQHDQAIREEYEAKGLPDDVVNELVEWKRSREQSKAEEVTKQQQAQQQADMREFIKEFPDVKPEDIPVEVWQANEKGVPLSYAYAKHAYKQATKAEEISKANEENAKSSTGSVSGLGGQSTALTQEMVDNMSPQELSSRWGEVKKLFKMK